MYGEENYTNYGFFDMLTIFVMQRVGMAIIK